jgi:hypothetical protein
MNTEQNNAINETIEIKLKTKLKFPKQDNPWLDEPEFDIVDELTWNSTFEKVITSIQSDSSYRVVLAMDIQIEDDMGGGIYLRGYYDHQVQKHKNKTKGMEVFLNGFLGNQEMKSLYTSIEDLKVAIHYYFLNKWRHSTIEIQVYRENPYFSVKLGLPFELLNEIDLGSNEVKATIVDYFQNKSTMAMDDKFFELIDFVCIQMKMNIQGYGAKIMAQHIYPEIINSLYCKNQYGFSPENPDFEFLEQCRNSRDCLKDFLNPEKWTAGIA